MALRYLAKISLRKLINIYVLLKKIFRKFRLGLSRQEIMMLNTLIHIEWANHLLKKIDLSGYKEILELGCRQGKLSAQLAQSYSKQKFTAIDNVESEIEQATQFCLPNLEFLLQDARHLYLGERFDAVVSFNNCLMWIKEKQNVFILI